MMPITYNLKKTRSAPASVYNSGHITVKKNNIHMHACITSSFLPAAQISKRGGIQKLRSPVNMRRVSEM